MARRKREPVERLDYHEGLSSNQVKIILREHGLDINEFNKWMFGQTCPILIRHDDKQRHITVGGYYEYDVFRWIAYKERRSSLLWD